MSASPGLRAALDYAERDFALLPIKPTTKRPNHPVLNEIYGSTAWTPLRERPASRPEIESWFKADPETDIGIITGSASNGLVVLDIDREPGLEFPATPTVRTRRGRHLYFRSAEPVEARGYAWGELRADGLYVVAPPSLHESGLRYAFFSGQTLEDLPLAELPLGTLAASPSAQGETKVSKAYLADPADQARFEWADLRKWDRDPDFVRAASRVIGLPDVDLGKKFCCLLPDHQEKSDLPPPSGRTRMGSSYTETSTQPHAKGRDKKH